MVHVAVKAQYNKKSTCYIKATQVNGDRRTENMMMGKISEVRIDWEVEEWGRLQIRPILPNKSG